MRSLVVMALALVCVFATESVFLNTPDKVLQSEEAGKIIQCLIKKGSCTELYLDIQDTVNKNFPEECIHCSPITKHKLGITFNYIKDHYTRDFEQYLDLIDPAKNKRDFTTNFLAENK